MSTKAEKNAETLMIKDEARANALGAFLKQMNKDIPGEVTLLSDISPRITVQAVPTGAISLDIAIGCGGFPRGRIIELYGPESTGKTTLALQTALNVQKAGGNIGFVDAEHALNLELCDNIGLDRSRMAIYQPEHGEAAIDMVVTMIDSGAFDMIIVDSVAAMVPKAELEAETEQQFMGLHARLMSRFMRIVAGKVSASGVMLVLVNQVRQNLGQYGNPETTTGGKAIKFFASVRIEVRSAASKKIAGPNGNAIGINVKATVKKNKVGPPFKEAEYDVIFGQGIDSSSALIGACEETGVITKASSSYTEVATGERLAVGKDKLKAKISQDPELEKRLTDAVYESFNNKSLVALQEISLEDTEFTDESDLS